MTESLLRICDDFRPMDGVTIGVPDHANDLVRVSVNQGTTIATAMVPLKALIEALERGK